MADTTLHRKSSQSPKQIEMRLQKITLYASGSMQFADDGPNRHTTNPSGPYSNLVDVSWERKLMDQILRKKKTMEATHGFWNISGSFIDPHVINSEKCALRRIISFYIDVVRYTQTHVDKVQDFKTEDYWIVDG